MQVLPADLTHADLGLESAVFEGFLRAFRIDSADKLRTLAQTYRLIQRYLAPFVVKVTIDMADDLVAAVADDPSTKIVFLGRDGFVFGFVLGVLLPDFYAQDCIPMYLPRLLVDSALRDLESVEGRDFSAAKAFRKQANLPSDPAEASKQLTTYFKLAGIDIGGAGTRVHLVDSGFKGSIQEMLAAAYPATSFFGHYTFFAASPHDPSPGTKRGYALHLESDCSAGGLALKDDLPGDPTLTFHHHEAIVAVEALISGSKGSPIGFGSHGRPRPRRHRHDKRPTDGINPALVEPQYSDSLMREAILTMSVIAIIHYAIELEPVITAGGPNWYVTARETQWYAELAKRSDVLRDQIRAWVARSGDAEPEFAKLLDAFVQRSNQDIIWELEELLRTPDLGDETRQRIWQLATKLYER
jgi:hypothetical protein